VAYKRSTIHLPEHIVSLIDVAKGSGESQSGRIAAIIERYAAMLADHLPELTPGEWNACMWVMRDSETIAPKMLWASIDDGCRDQGLSERFAIDGHQLVKKLRSMDTAGALAIAEVARRYWAAEGEGGALAKALDEVKHPARRQ
jgi:hypothetical protein